MLVYKVRSWYACTRGNCSAAFVLFIVLIFTTSSWRIRKVNMYMVTVNDSHWTFNYWTPFGIILVYAELSWVELVLIRLLYKDEYKSYSIWKNSLGAIADVWFEEKLLEMQWHIWFGSIKILPYYLTACYHDGVSLEAGRESKIQYSGISLRNGQDMALYRAHCSNVTAMFSFLSLYLLPS